jgi:exodeoxyribonuclease VII large subunit
VSAVGHETDFTLTDFAADLRAPTPSAAAELAVPDRVELLVRLDGVGARLQNSLRGIAERARLSLERLESRVPFARPQDLFAAQAQRVDEVSEALDRAMEARLETAEHRLERLGARLDDLGPTQTLARGYAIARGPDGQVLRQAKQVEVGSGLEVILADGALDASVTRVRAEGTKPGE